MIPSFKPLLIIISAAFLFSCNPSESTFVYKGEINKYSSTAINYVDASPDESYYIYIPSNYNKDEFYPLMLCFSQKGNGLNPVEKMRFAAESLGYIIVGSNVVRNNFEGNGVAIRNLIYDVQNKYNVDPFRMYACGFSGGGRLSTVLGNQGVLAGVISCGAGPGRWSKTDPYPWYGIIGKTDFNYNEFAQFSLDILQKPFYSAVFFKGGHEWPDSSYLYDATAFLEIHAMKSNKIDNDSALLLGYMQYVENKVDQLKFHKNYIDAFHFANDAATLLSGLVQSNDLIHLAGQVFQSTEYKMEVAKQAELDKLYNELMKLYPATLTQKDTVWWKGEIEKLDTRIAQTEGEASYTFKRVKASLGILCYSYCRQLMRTNNAIFQNVLLVYELIEPNNPDVYYYWSVYEKNKGNLDRSAQYLEKAKSLGFSDIEKVTG